MEIKITSEIRELCQQLANLYADKLAEDNAVATGKLINSLNHVIIENDENGVSVYFELPEYWKYAPENERTGGKMPPVEPLEQWIRDKRLNVEESKIPSVAWAIALKIKEEGWDNQPRHNFIDTLSNPKFNDICDRIENAIYQQVIDSEIDNLIDDL